MELTQHSAAAVAQICTLLDGIPLALELGAAATTTFSVQEIAERLAAGRLPAAPGYRDAAPRHKSIDDTVAWSYNLLSPAERHLLAQLAVFAGGWTLDALQQVAADIPNCVTLLGQLVQKSLVRVEHTEAEAGGTRYHLLRAVREYAAERLVDSGNAEAVRRRHFAYFVQSGVRLGGQVLGPQHRAAMAGLDAEYPNIRAALVFAASKADLAEEYTRLAVALPFFWHRRGAIAEGLTWLHHAIQGEQSLTLSSRALVRIAVLNLRVDTSYGSYHFYYLDEDDQWMLAQADALIEPCLERGDEHTAALLMFTVASMRDYPGSEAKVEAYARRAWSTLERLGDLRSAGFACNLLTRLLILQGDLESAQSIHQGALRLFEQTGMTWGLCESYRLRAEIAGAVQDQAEMMRSLKRIAEISEQQQFAPFLHEAFCQLERADRVTACRMAEAVLERQRRLGPSALLGLALHQLGRIYLNMGNYQQAASLLDEALQLWPRLDQLHGAGLNMAWSLIDRGQAARFLGDTEMAIACFSESIRLFAAETDGYYPMLFRGQMRAELGDLAGALEDYRPCLSMAFKQPHASRHSIVNCLASIGEVVRQRGNISTAAKLIAAAAALDAKWGALAVQSWPHEVVHYEHIMATASLYRQDPVFAAAWQEGEGLTFQEAADLALET